MIPDKDQRWHAPVAVTNDRIFGVLTILKYCLDRIAPQSGWPGRVARLLADSPGIPRPSMGFPDGWERCAIWKEPSQ